MRYAVYKAWSVSGFAELATKDGPESRFIPFDGTPKGSNWRPNPMFVPHPDRKPWDAIPIYGPSALILTEHARKVLQPVFDSGRYELLPLTCDGLNYTVVNIMEVIDCLDRGKCVFDAFGIVKKYAFLPDRITHSLFKIPEAVTGSFLVAEDSDSPTWGLKYLVEKNQLQGIEFRLIWSFDGRRIVSNPAPLTLGALTVVEASPSGVSLRWIKMPGVNLYSVRWSKNGVDFFIVDAVEVNDANQVCTYIDHLPTAGRTFYKVVGIVRGKTAALSEAVEVNLDRGDGDINP